MRGMAYFRNPTVNLLNAHYVMTAAAQAGGGAFYGIWLLEAGISLPLVLLAVAAIFALRFVMRGAVLPLAVRFGLRPLVFTGALLMAIAYLLVPGVTGADGRLAVLVLMTALAQTIYWPSYHAYYAGAGDAEHRGQQLGVREAVGALAGIVSPLAAGWLLVRYGPRAAFAATALLQALAGLPLLFTPVVRVAPSVPGGYRAALPGALLFCGDGLITAGTVTVWQFALFFALGRDPLAYGGALALAALAGAVGVLLLGRLIDAGQGRRVSVLAMAFMAAIIVLRAEVDPHRLLALPASALGALASCFYVPVLMTALYNQAKRAPCPMRFHIAAEAGWDSGMIAGLVLAAGLVALGLPAATAVLVALLGAALVLVLLRRYYRDHAEPVDAALHHREEGV